MAYKIDSIPAKVREDLANDLLAIADTKLVLGNWYAETVMNGRSLPDFAGILAMCQVNYGHTRAIYQYLVNYGHDYAHLERGRGPADVRSMNILDKAPDSWEDMICATWLAEQANWMLMSGFLKHPDRTLSGLAEHIGQEVYFHFKYCHGWMRIIGEGKRERDRFAASFKERYPLALAWFGEGDADSLHKAGQRNASLAKLREAFVKEVAKGKEMVQTTLAMPKSATAPKGWRADARRAGPLPGALFDIVRFKDPEAAH